MRIGQVPDPFPT